MKRLTIALDGSAASGKSTLGCALAAAFDCLYLDTGVMYRAVTWAALNAHIEPQNEAAVSNLAAQISLEILPPTHDDGRQITVLVDGVDITWEIRTQTVNQYVSLVSSYPKVRNILTEMQRKIAEQGPVVMCGRDIGTVVLPNADFKFFIEASPEVRARRRYEEHVARGETLDYDELLASIIRRDKLDREKLISPMIAADDAITISTDSLSKEALLEQVSAHIRRELTRQGA